MNQPTNQAIGGQASRLQNITIRTIHVNLSFDNLNAEQKYEYLTKGVVDPFARRPEATNQTISQFSVIIFSGSPF
ncbi:hypothetical protein F8M41_016832 [Gigaspora margarita]|uniref:Uncharacterized protein n=1 Tax=Gigaspora margarita TaxID=4874 RepID=A0A8H4ANU3_GIGMA|nr:hypothetical protein F8M41_016832 [Gigaspora margarita]